MEQMKTPNTANKLTRLFEAHPDRPKTAAARAAEISHQAIGRYLEGTPPRADALLKVAVFFGVDPAWLADETQEWIDPPPPPGAMLTDEELMAELRRRKQREEERLDALLSRAERVDWEDVSRVLAGESKPGGDPYAADPPASRHGRPRDARRMVEAFHSREKYDEQTEAAIVVIRDLGLLLRSTLDRYSCVGSDQREAYADRIEVIMERVGSSEGAAKTLMTRFQREVFDSQPKAVLGRLDENLTRCGV